MFENVTIETLSTPSEEKMLLNPQNYLGITREQLAQVQKRAETNAPKWTMCETITCPCWCPIATCCVYLSLCCKK